jgi:hypothetical protein
MTITSTQGAAAYIALNRLVSPLVPPTVPAPETLARAAGERFEPAGLPPPLALPPGPPPAPTPTPAPATAPLAAPVVPPTPTDPGGGAPTVATATRATTAYAQGQRLGASLPPAQLSATTPAGPGDAAGPTPPTAAAQPGGAVGISALGGAAQSPTQLLSFTRGSFINVMV